jgi:hypothetical protein
MTSLANHRAHAESGRVAGAALFLLVAPGLLAEVLSQNVPLFTYLQPMTLLFGSLAYGVPVLLIRELSAARRLNPLGVALLGVGYGILNEGVLAKTLTQASGAPLHDFAGYGQVGALQLGWTIFIVPWHALHSVLYPILLAAWLFPSTASRRWFATGRARVALYMLVVVFAGLYLQYFLTSPAGGIAMFWAYALSTLALVAIALRYCVTRAGPSSRQSGAAPLRPALAGGLTIFLYVAAFSMPARVPFALYLAFMMGSMAAAALAMKRGGWRPLPELLLFGLGDYLAFAVLAALLAAVGGRDAWEAAAAVLVFVAVCGVLLRHVPRRPFGRGGARPAAST